MPLQNNRSRTKELPDPNGYSQRPIQKGRDKKSKGVFLVQQDGNQKWKGGGIRKEKDSIRHGNTGLEITMCLLPIPPGGNVYIIQAYVAASGNFRYGSAGINHTTILSSTQWVRKY